MSSIADKTLDRAFSFGKRMTPGYMVYNSTKVDGVVGFITSQVTDKEDAGHDTGYADVTLIVKTEDVEGWGLTRGDVLLMVGGSVSGSVTVREDVRYLGTTGQYTWYNFDKTR